MNIFDAYNDVKEAEEAVLGAILISPDLLKTALGILDAENFARESHADLFKAMRDMWRRNKDIDLITLHNQMGGTEEVKKYLIYLSDSVPVVTNIADYCNIVKSASLGRKAMELVQNTDFRGAGGGDTGESIKTLSGKLAELIRDTSRRKFRTLQEVAAEVYQDVMFGDPTKDRINTGISGLDEILDGIYPSDLVTIAAGTGVGKTAFMLQILMNMAKTGKKIALYTLEMKDKQNVQRMMAKLSGVSLKKIKNGSQLTESESENLNRAYGEMSGCSVMIDDKGGLKADDIRLDLLVNPDIDIVIVDHVGLMYPERQFRDRYQSLTQIMIDLKALAQQANKPIIALCQLNRETRFQKEPEIWNLRDSGEIEQSSTAVILMWKKQNYEETGNLGVKVAKNRQGTSGKICVRFDAPRMSFYEVTDEYEDGEVYKREFPQSKPKTYKIND